MGHHGCNDELDRENERLRSREKKATRDAAAKALFKRALVFVRASAWSTRNASENRYCTSCATAEDRWIDQEDHHPTCEWTRLVLDLERAAGE